MRRTALDQNRLDVLEFVRQVALECFSMMPMRKKSGCGGAR